MLLLVLFESCFALIRTLAFLELLLLSKDSSGVVSTIDSSDFLLLVSSTAEAADTAESSGVDKQTDWPSSDN